MPQRAVIVAGATSGIGLAIAEMAVPRGYHVILVGRDQDALAQAVERVRGRGGSCEGVACDLTVPEQVKRVVSEVRQRDLAAWIHCAGQMTYGEVIDTPWATFREVLDTNVGSVFLAAQAVMPRFRQQGHGAFIVLGSALGHLAVPDSAPYVTSKWALRGLLGALRLEQRRFAGIHVVEIAPWGCGHTDFRQSRSLQRSRGTGAAAA